jgi:hypothetical protein
LPVEAASLVAVLGKNIVVCSVVILSGAKDPEGLDSSQPPGPFQQPTSPSSPLPVLVSGEECKAFALANKEGSAATRLPKSCQIPKPRNPMKTKSIDIAD